MLLKTSEFDTFVFQTKLTWKNLKTNYDVFLRIF